MAIGQVEVNNLNLGQGSAPEIERHFLFIGRTAKTELQGTVTRINAATNLDDVVANDALGNNVIAAQANGKQNWTAAIYGLGDAASWEDAIDHANQSDSFEAVVLVDVTTDKAQFDLMQAKAESLTSKLGRWIFILAATP
ncbi:DUF2586 domain-containing protein, partial [Photobacterium kishitanii]|uniref:DUF2586 family protein n=1 Tax=Photobacterium kishitanii TaxID=318456 RepID=UPI000D496F7C